MQGQANHFVRYAPEKIEYGMKRYTNETKRLYGVIEQHLSQGREWLAAGQYTIADMANFSWIFSHAWAGQSLAELHAHIVIHQSFAGLCTHAGLQVCPDMSTYTTMKRCNLHLIFVVSDIPFVTMCKTAFLSSKQAHFIAVIPTAWSNACIVILQCFISLHMQAMVVCYVMYVSSPVVRQAYDACWHAESMYPVCLLLEYMHI